jgi:DNA-binding FrmR family transcriptional regulator
METQTRSPGYIDDKEALLKRTRRIAGQVGGIERMIEDERYCIDILTQISAIQAALDKVAVGLLDDHARHCVIGASAANREQKTEEMMGAVARLLRS